MQDNQNMSEKTGFSLLCEKWYYKGMIYFGLFFTEIAILFFLSRNMSRILSKFMSVNFLAFFLLPGVIIHELAHLFMAAVLFVPAGDMEFTPKRSANGLKLGSIQIAKTDPIRRSIIGFAPVFVGLMLVVGIVYFFTSNILFFKDKDSYFLVATGLGVIYLLFAISNTMFSSSRDMEGTIEIIVTLLIIVLLLYLVGVRVPLSWAWNFMESNIDLIKKSTMFLLAPISIDLFILGLVRFFDN